MTMKCVNGIDADRLRAGEHEFPDAAWLYIGHFVPLSGYPREIFLDAGRIPTKIGNQLAGTRRPGQSKPAPIIADRGGIG